MTSSPSATHVFSRLRAAALLCCCLAFTGCLGLPLGGAGKSGQPPAARPGTPPPGQPQQSACLVLALPDGGPFAPFAQKIRSGATAAQKEMNKGGYQIRIQSIDTSQPDWLTRLEALPAECAVVGGPLQAPNYAALKAAGTRRHVFAFMPQIGADEGKTAWRFFPGPADQVAALLRFTRQDLGITSYGALYPSDTYGARMTGLFEQAVRSGGGTVQAVSYPPADMGQWTKAAETLTRPRFVNKVPLPTAANGAIFLPDSWKNMDMLTTSLLYNGEDRAVLLGTSLWEQSLTGQGTVNTYNFALAVFPGAWDPTRVPPALQAAGNADFWTGLGYDFARFGAALALQGGASASTVNARIRQAQNMPWAMAPMHWTAQGQASQQLFLFVPTSTGFAPLDVPAFKERRDQLLTRFENRSRAAASQGQ